MSAKTGREKLKIDVATKVHANNLLDFRIFFDSPFIDLFLNIFLQATQTSVKGIERFIQVVEILIDLDINLLLSFGRFYVDRFYLLLAGYQARV